MSINIIRKNPLKPDRSLYRLNLDIPVLFIPVFSDEQQGHAYHTEMVNLSGSGCKIKLPEEWSPETAHAIVEFALDEFLYRLRCNIVRRNTPYHIVALQFVEPLSEIPNSISMLTMTQVEERIIQYVFRRLQEMDALPQLYRKKL